MNLEKLPDYNTEARCVKCGENSVGAEFLTIYRALRNYHGKIELMMTLNAKDLKEVIRRKCDNCDYEWLENTIGLKESDLK